MKTQNSTKHSDSTLEKLESVLKLRHHNYFQTFRDPRLTTFYRTLKGLKASAQRDCERARQFAQEQPGQYQIAHPEFPALLDEFLEAYPFTFKKRWDPDGMPMLSLQQMEANLYKICKLELERTTDPAQRTLLAALCASCQMNVDEIRDAICFEPGQLYG